MWCFRTKLLIYKLDYTSRKMSWIIPKLKFRSGNNTERESKKKVHWKKFGSHSTKKQEEFTFIEGCENRET